jgi:hypothetical protein
MILKSSANTVSIRTRAQNELMAGVRPKPNEDLMSYGRRVLRVTRDSMLPGTPEETVEDLAIGHFLKNVGDPLIHNALALRRNELNYRQFLDQAVMLRDSNIAAGYTRPSPIARPYEYAPRRMDRGGRQELFGRRIDDGRENNRYSMPPSDYYRTNGEMNSANAGVRSVQRENRMSFHPATVAPRVQQPAPTAVATRPKPTGVNALEEEEIPPPGDYFNRCSSATIGTSVVPERQSNHPPKAVARSSGPTVVEYLRVFGLDVESQIDSGANVSLIGKRCLRAILAKNGIEPRDAGIHDTPYSTCEAVNGTTLTFIGAITFPVEKCGQVTYVEFQISREKPAFPIVVGTNALTSLGYQLIDVSTGKDCLRAEPSAPCPPSHSLSATVAKPAPFRVAIVPKQHVRFCSADVKSVSYSNGIDELLEAVSGIKFHGVTECLILLPSVTDGYAAKLKILIETLSSIESTQFHIVPPPPSRSPDYDESVQVLLACSSPNVVTKHEFRGRTLYSLGLIGLSLNNHESKNGDWTQAGLKAIQKFLSECMQVKWPFRAAVSPRASSTSHVPKSASAGATHENPSPKRALTRLPTAPSRESQPPIKRVRDPLQAPTCQSTVRAIVRDPERYARPRVFYRSKEPPSTRRGGCSTDAVERTLDRSSPPRSNTPQSTRARRGRLRPEEEDVMREKI